MTVNLKNIKLDFLGNFPWKRHFDIIVSELLKYFSFCLYKNLTMSDNLFDLTVPNGSVYEI